MYWLGYKITAVIIFIGSWIYCIANYGFLFGVGLGWLPSLIVAFLASFLWPLFVFGLFCLLILLLHEIKN